MGIETGFNYGGLGGPPTAKGTTRWISHKGQFPAPVAGVITLPADTTWVIVADVDLEGDRLVCSGISTLVGFGPETCKLRSTGLAGGEALISSNSSLTLRSIGLYADTGRTVVRIDGTGTSPRPALDWFAVNFNEGSATPGKSAELVNVENAIMILIGCFGDGIYVDGDASPGYAVQTLALVESILVANDGLHGIKIEAGAAVGRRLRLVNCAVIAGPPGATGLGVPSASISNSEGFILDLVNFSGSGTYVTGTTEQDDQARWLECRGITNTTRVGEMWWSGNALVTNIAAAGTYVKAVGVSVAGAFNQHFDHDTSGTLTYTSELVGTFLIAITASVSGSNNRVVGVRAYKDGAAASTHVTKSTTNGAGRAESIFYQAIVQLEQGSELELWVTNLSDTSALTLEDMTYQVRKI